MYSFQMAEVTKKCAECKQDYASFVLLCNHCYNSLLSDKYDDFAFVLATLNNKLSDLLTENKSLKEKLTNFEKENVKTIK